MYVPHIATLKTHTTFAFWNTLITLYHCLRKKRWKGVWFISKLNFEESMAWERVWKQLK